MVQGLTQVSNTRGANIDAWTNTGQTVTAELQTADDAALQIAGARGRTVTKIAFVEGRHSFVPEKVRLVGAETWLVTEVFGVYVQHTELGLQQINP